MNESPLVGKKGVSLVDRLGEKTQCVLVAVLLVYALGISDVDIIGTEVVTVTLVGVIAVTDGGMSCCPIVLFNGDTWVGRIVGLVNS